MTEEWPNLLLLSRVFWRRPRLHGFPRGLLSRSFHAVWFKAEFLPSIHNLTELLSGIDAEPSEALSAAAAELGD
jgi:hypothetical protein